MATEINQTWEYQQSPEEVWDYLTQSELLGLWLMKNNIKPEMGYEFEFRTNPIPSLNLDGIVYCKVVELVPFQKLTYTWKAGPGDGKFTLDTVVEWTLERMQAGTRLLLKQTGFTDKNASIFNSMTIGWDRNMQKMITDLTNKKNGHTHA